MKLFKMASSLLLVLGGINWGLHGVLDLDLVHLIFGSLGNLANIVYGLIGISAVHYVLEGNIFDVD